MSLDQDRNRVEQDVRSVCTRLAPVPCAFVKSLMNSEMSDTILSPICPRLRAWFSDSTSTEVNAA